MNYFYTFLTGFIIGIVAVLTLTWASITWFEREPKDKEAQIQELKEKLSKKQIKIEKSATDGLLISQ